MALRMAKLPSLLWMFVLLAVLDGASATNFCKQVVEPIGYGCTEFSVQTDDGFVLVMHRLGRINSLVGDGHIGAAQPPVNSGNNVTEKDQPQSRGQRVQCVGPPVSWIPDIRPASGDSNGSHHASGSSSSTLESRDSHNSCSNDRTTQVATSSASDLPSQTQGAPAIHGSGHTDRAQPHSNASNGTTQDGMLPIQSRGPNPAPRTSVSSNRTSEDSSSEQAAVAAGPATSTIQNASMSSTPKQPITRSSPSNYTANPGAGKGSPVLLMHMEFLNGDSWFQYVDADRHVSRLLPIMLMEDGFDVWIGHQRATYWGHGHVKHKSTDREYWNWTWDEHVKYDLSAQLRFISTETNQPVHFIGASEAATVATAAATDHETAQMFRSLTLIGPTAFRGNSNSFLLNAWAYFFGAALDSQYYATGFQNGAFNYSMEFPQTGPISGQGLTGMIMGLISGPNCCLGSASIQFTNGWDGTTSFKNLLHWQQGIRTNNFAHYDYGSAASNIQAYGRPTPPAYNIAQIPSQLPMLIIEGGSDWTAPPQGTNRLVSQMQHLATIVNLTNYAHFDLLFSVKRETDIYLPILQFLEGPEFE